MERSMSARTKVTPDLSRYYTRAEVELHNAPTDLWISWLGMVYDLTVLAEERKGDPLLAPILKNAGKDISHWFDKRTGDLKQHINPLTGAVTPYTPEGRFLHVPPPLPRADWAVCETVTPWWLDRDAYCIGKLSQRTRKIRIINTLTKDEHVIEVCAEERLSAIQERYMAYNSHAKGYMWKRLGVLLDMNVTLEQNGIRDEGIHMERLGMDEEQYLPAIHLYFSFRTPNFELVADILHWLVKKYDPNIDISDDVSTEQDRIIFIKSIAMFLPNLTNPNQDSLGLSPLDISSKVPQLKACRILASEITEQGSKLHDSLGKELNIRDIRNAVISRPFELKAMESAVHDAITNLSDQISEMKSGLENLASDETNLMAKIEKRRTEFERAEKRLKSLQGVRPAYMDDYEKIEVELVRLYEIYMEKFRNLTYLEQQLDEHNKLEQDKFEQPLLQDDAVSLGSGMSDGDDLLSPDETTRQAETLRGAGGSRLSGSKGISNKSRVDTEGSSEDLEIGDDDEGNDDELSNVDDDDGMENVDGGGDSDNDNDF
ncbi:Cytochrome b5 domain-containing protein 1 [Dinochytrium kinnereticum]|nr:Cytochrome b5 domain-containing protein 1 [Dinochytrium kinnereticum]